MINKAGFWIAAGAAFALSLSAAQAQSDGSDYPNQPVTLVVGFSPGGATDTLARVIVEDLSEALGQPVVIENRPGAGGYVGYRSVAASEPDGYTVLLAENAIALGKALRPDEQLDPVTELEAIGRVATAPLALLVNSSLSPTTLDELVEFSKNNDVNFSSSGVGAVSHMTFEALAGYVGIEAQHVPYRGGGESNAALAGGHVQAIMTNLGNAVRMIEEGSARGLAVSSPERVDSIPDVPTLTELGVDSEVELRFWWGLFTPVGIPDPVKEKLQGALQQVLNDPDAVERMAKIQAVADFAPGEEMSEVLQTEITNWRAFVEEKGITVE